MFDRGSFFWSWIEKFCFFFFPKTTWRGESAEWWLNSHNSGFLRCSNLSKRHCTVNDLCVFLKQHFVNNTEEDGSGEAKKKNQRRRVLFHMFTHTHIQEMVPGSFVVRSFDQSGGFSTLRAGAQVCASCTDCQASSNQCYLQVRILSGLTVELLPAPLFPRWLILRRHFEDWTVSCSDRRDRAKGWGIITDWTPLSLHGSRPRKFSWWCVSSVRLRARWGGTGGLVPVWVSVHLEVECGVGGWGGRGLVTTLLGRWKKERKWEADESSGCERWTGEWMDERLHGHGWFSGCMKDGWVQQEGGQDNRENVSDVSDVNVTVYCAVWCFGKYVWRPSLAFQTDIMWTSRSNKTEQTFFSRILILTSDIFPHRNLLFLTSNFRFWIWCH